MRKRRVTGKDSASRGQQRRGGLEDGLPTGDGAAALFVKEVRGRYTRGWLCYQPAERRGSAVRF